MPDLIERVAKSLEEDPLVQHFEAAFQGYPDLLMKDMTLEAVGPDRQAKLNGRWVVNFGSDSFLGLDQDPRVRDAVRRGLDRWGKKC
jgi:7-keto-8-aminopelargonate synthetase-like enzyme